MVHFSQSLSVISKSKVTETKNTLFAHVKKFWMRLLWEHFSMNIRWNKNLKFGIRMVCGVSVKSAKFGQLVSCCSLHVRSKKLLWVFRLILTRLLPWWMRSVGDATRSDEAPALQFCFLIALCEVRGLTSRTKRFSQGSALLDQRDRKSHPSCPGWGGC